MFGAQARVVMRLYLFLLHRGEPTAISTLAEAMRTTERAVLATVARTNRIEPAVEEGKYQLTEWKLRPGRSPHESTIRVILEVLAERGPQDFGDLQGEWSVATR